MENNKRKLFKVA